MEEEEATIENTYDPNAGAITANVLIERRRYFDNCIQRYLKNETTENRLGGEK